MQAAKLLISSMIDDKIITGGRKNENKGTKKRDYNQDARGHAV